MSTFALKIIAILTMLTDHIGYVFFPDAIVLRLVGRIAFPIFCYTLVEGFLHTRSVKNYLIRLGIFAILSEIPFDLAFSGKVWEFQNQNVFLTLFFGVVMLCLLEKAHSYVACFSIAVILTLICKVLHTDYASVGLLIIFTLYMFRENRKEQLALAALVMMLFSGKIQMFSLFALIPIAFHNKTQGPKMKLFFYLFYPVHLLAIYFISILV